MAKVPGGYISNSTGVFITDEEFEELDPEFRYYVYEEEPLFGKAEHDRDEHGGAFYLPDGSYFI